MSNNQAQPNTAEPKVLYLERQWVPWYWWLIAAFIVALISAQFALNRAALWLYIPAVVLSVLAAFVVSHGWVPEMVMLVLDDPEDPTPYWLVASKHPEQLLAAFLPEQQSDADQAVVTTRNA